MQGILLTFSESDGLGGHAKQLLDCLKDMQQTLQLSKEQLGMLDGMTDVAVAGVGQEQPVEAAVETKKPVSVQKSDDLSITL